MKSINKIIALISFTALMLHVNSPAQGVFVDPREAEEFFQHENYLSAMPVYKKLIEQSPGNAGYYYKLGMCYLNTNVDKAKAIYYFEWVTKHSKSDNEAWYELGEAYHYANRFTDAIRAFNHYMQNAGAANKAKAVRQIAECNTGIQLIKRPVNVTFTNLGSNINSQYPDYYPLVNGDESELIFTSRRPGVNAMHVEMDGYYSSDIYISHAVNGVWQKAKSIGEQINSTKDEEAVGLSPVGNELVIYIDNIKQDGKIYYSMKKGNTYQKPLTFPDDVNVGFQSSGDISADGRILFFASERPGGYGGTDIYMVRKLPDGKTWGAPQNLGSSINTPYNEDFPWFDADSVSLYFSSQGHNTMGDYDLFESIWTDPDSNKWSTPSNLGFPINTTGDDRCISFTKDHHAAYISRASTDGKGDLDIYRVTFNDMQRYAIVRGSITTGDKKSINAIITTTNVATKEELFFKPAPKTGRYIIALVPGAYDVKIDCAGYPTIFDKLVIYDLSSFQNEMIRNYTFSPLTGSVETTKKQLPISAYRP